MKISSNIIVSLAVLSLGAALTAAPAFAQYRGFGHRHGYGPLYDYVPAETPSTYSIYDPAVTGGGSLGGNKLLDIGTRW